MGKGDLEPDLIMVFESDVQIIENPDRLLECREMVKAEFNVSKIYHTFMVRCQPKACVIRNSTSCYLHNNKLIDRELRCLLSGKPCEGIPIKPADNDIISCLPYLLEELEILNPKILMLFGERVSEFVLKAYGIFEDYTPGAAFYDADKRLFITLPEPEEFSPEECKRIAEQIAIKEDQGKAVD
jgi:uracil-DNA glycosylase